MSICHESINWCLLLRLRSKKAVSTIVATVIMVNIAVVLGVTAYLYQQNMLGVMIGNYGLYVDRNSNMMQERISIVNIRYTDRSVDTGKLNITVLNSGSRHVNISAIYLNGTDIMNEVEYVWNGVGTNQSSPSQGTYLITVGNSSTFAFKKDGVTVSNIKFGCTQSIVVVTVDGVKASEEWLATKAV
jgi:archaellum component FlaF (FlaF/FlaG flagellin family)